MRSRQHGPGHHLYGAGAHSWVKGGKLLGKGEPGAKLAHFPPHGR